MRAWIGAWACLLCVACGHTSQPPATPAVDEYFDGYNPETHVASFAALQCPNLSRLADYFFSQGEAPLPIITLIDPTVRERLEAPTDVDLPWPDNAMDAEVRILDLYYALPKLRGIIVHCAFYSGPAGM